MVKYRVPWPSKTVRITNPAAKFSQRENAGARRVHGLVGRFVKTR